MHDRSSSDVALGREDQRRRNRQQLVLRVCVWEGGNRCHSGHLAADSRFATEDTCCLSGTDRICCESAASFCSWWEVWGPGQIVKECSAKFLPGREWKSIGKAGVDSAAAIQELERLRIEGANYIVFAWPTLLVRSMTTLSSTDTHSPGIPVTWRRRTGRASFVAKRICTRDHQDRLASEREG